MFTVDSIISDSNRRISRSQRNQLKESLNHGKNILQTDEQLAAYLSWYGEMHKIKCLVANQNFPYNDLGIQIHIVDWGCGQAIASLCFLESLAQRSLLAYVRKVTLIEPSVVALARAKANIEKALGNRTIQIECINRKLPSYSEDNPDFPLNLDCSTTIHLFSNILDIVDISLKKTASIIEMGHGIHYVLCVGPCNGNKKRIDDFCNFFSNRTDFSNIENCCIAHTSDTHYPITCKTRCFYIDAGHSQLDTSYLEGHYEDSGAYDDYDTTGLLRNGLITENQLKVYQHISRQLSIYDNIFLKPELGSDTPDLVIVRKGKGIVVLNVFEGDLRDCINGENGFTYKGLPMGSPLSTIIGYRDNILTERSSTLLRNAIKEKGGWFTVRPAIWFPDSTKEQIAAIFHTDIEKTSVLLLGKEDFGRNVYDALDIKFPRKSFTDEAYYEFLGLLKTNWHTFRNGDLSLRLRAEQVPLAKSESGKRQKIKGVAGSGKTQVLAARAVNCQLRTGGDVLILTYNVTLVNYIRYRLGQIPSDFLWNKFTISNYHRFFVSQARNHYLKMSLTCFENEVFFEPKKNDVPKYSAILVDEVQDYESSWLRVLLKYFLAENGEFVLFGDAKQNIYRRTLDTDMEIITPIPGKWTEKLNVGQRFDNMKLAALATSYQKYFFPEQVVNEVQPQLEFGYEAGKDYFYELYEANATPQDIASKCLQLINDNDLEKSNTVILSQTYPFLRGVEFSLRNVAGCCCMTTFETQEVYNKLLSDSDGNAMADLFRESIKKVRDNKKLHFTMDTDLLKISSIHSYKGWDADNVILIIQPDDDFIESGESILMSRPELIYTAITRAKQKLFILNLGNRKYDGFFAKRI